MTRESDLNAQAKDLREATNLLDSKGAALRDAMNNLTQARADLEAVVGDSAEMMALRAAVDDVTAAVSAATAHGARKAAVSPEK
jgi:hypothetical protein